MRHEWRIRTQSQEGGGHAKLSLLGEVIQTCRLLALEGMVSKGLRQRVGSGVREQTS